MKRSKDTSIKPTHLGEAISTVKPTKKIKPPVKPKKKVSKPTPPSPPKDFKPKEKVIKISETQLPVGEGKEKASRLEARVKSVFNKTSQEEIERLGLPTFKQLNNKENIKKASDYVVNNPEEALKVVKGEIDPPPGILKNSVYVALKNLGSADTEIATKIASLASTRMGQEISILREIEIDSPVTFMEDVTITRIEADEKRTGNTETQRVKTETKKITSKTKFTTKEQWNSFIESIRC